MTPSLKIWKPVRKSDYKFSAQIVFKLVSLFAIYKFIITPDTFFLQSVSYTHIKYIWIEHLATLHHTTLTPPLPLEVEFTL
jgi:hypothetical protein